MFRSNGRISVRSREFKYWIRNLPNILTKDQLQQKYLGSNLNVVDDNGKMGLSTIRLVAIAKEYGKTVI